MARNDIKIATPTSQLFSIKWLVAAGAQGSSGGGGYMGEPFVSYVATAAQTGIVKVAADGAGVVGTTAATNGRFVGIAKTDSTQTASAAGVVYTWAPLPGILYYGKVKTSTTFDTQAEIDALKGSAVFFDLTAATSGTYSVDAAATDAAANALVIVDGNINSGLCYFTVKEVWSVINNSSTLS